MSDMNSGGQFQGGQSQGGPAPGWYPDGQGAERWWDGHAWTTHARPLNAGQPHAPQAPFQQSYGQQADQTRIAGQRSFSSAPGQQNPYGQQNFGLPQTGGHPGATASKSGGSNLWIWVGVGALAICVLGGLLIGIVRVAGGGGSGGSPTDVVNDYLSAAEDGDCDRIRELITDELEAQADPCAAPDLENLPDVPEAPDAEVSQSVGSESITGTEATVPVDVTTTINGETTTIEITYNLVDTDGEGWLIDGIDLGDLPGLEDLPDFGS